MKRLTFAALVLAFLLATPASAVDPTPPWAPLPSDSFRPVPDRAAQAETPTGAPERQPAASHPSQPAVASTAASSVPTRSMPALSGIASWYCCTAGYGDGLYAAAGPALRVGNWRGTVVTVSADGVSVRVQLVDVCQCYGARLIDLEPAAFARLAPLSVGLVEVKIAS